MDISRCIGYTAATMSALFYSGGVATAQLLGNTYPRFELNLIRLAAQMTLCLFVIIVKRQTVFTIKTHRDITLLMGGACAYTWMVLSLNLAPLYAPVGNLESVAITVYVVLTVMVSVCQRKASWAIIAAAFISCAGVVLLTQPDFLFVNKLDITFIKDPCPCADMSSTDMTSRTVRCTSKFGQHVKDMHQYYMNSSIVVIHEYKDARIYKAVPHKAVSNQTEVMPAKHGMWRLPGMEDETFGYLLAATTGLTFFTFIQINEKVLLPSYGFLVVTFWCGVIGSALSALLMLSLETPVVTGIASCVWMTALHGVFASGSLILQNFSLCHMGADENAIILTLSVAVLFIAQATILKQYQPTHSNVYEYLGAVLVILACLVEPIYQMLTERKGKAVKEFKKGLITSGLACPEDKVCEKTALLVEKYPTQHANLYSGV